MFICNILIYYTYNSSFIVLFFVSWESLTLAAYIVHDIVFIQEFFLHGLIEHNDRRFVSVSDKVI